MAKLLLLLFLILPTQQTIINYVNEMNLESSNGVFTINKDLNSDFVRFKRDTAETSTKSPSTTPPSKKGLPSSIDSSIGKIIPKVIIFVIYLFRHFGFLLKMGKKSNRLGCRSDF